MAVQPSGGRTVPLFVLIIFVVLFLAAVTGLVLLFVHQETVRQEAQQAKSQFETYMGPMLTSKLDPYKGIGSSQRPSKTAVAALLDERDQLGVLLTGNKGSTPKEVMDRLNKAIASLPESSVAAKKLKDISKSDLVGALQQAALLLKNQTDEMTTLQSQLAETQKSRDTVTAGYKDLEEKFKEKTDQFANQLTELKKLTDTIQKDFSDQLEMIKTQVSKELRDQMEAKQKQNLLRLDELRDLVRRNLAALISSSRESGSEGFRAGAMMSPDQLTQKADSEVLDLAGPVVYVGLGSKQKIKPGIRFCVVSSTSRGQVSPAVKGVLEVTRTGEMTSECRIVKSSPANPIIPGDLVLNLVYNQELPLVFLVFGDFDLEHTGVADPNGVAKVAEIITTAGGKVVHQITPDVNFAIMGQPPAGTPAPTTTQASEENPGKSSTATKNYGDLKDQVQALGIAVIAPDFFIKYTGFAAKLD